MKKDYNNFSLLSLSQASKLLNIGRENLNHLVMQGKIRVIKIKSQLKVPYSELERFINENMVTYSDNTLTNQLEYFTTSTAKPNYNSVEIFKKLRGEI